MVRAAIEAGAGEPRRLVGQRVALAGGDPIVDDPPGRVAIGIAVATRCDGCVGFHAKAAIKAGATREEVLETLSMAIYMGAGPSMIYAAEALRAFDELAAPPPAA